MSLKRIDFNVILLICTLVLGGLVVRIFRQPNLSISNLENEGADTLSLNVAKIAPQEIPVSAIPDSTNDVDNLHAMKTENIEATEAPEVPIVKASEICDIEIKLLTDNHPFKEEAKKILSGKLKDVDSINRRSILNYCEHLRTAYTTRDIDFIRQVFSEEALIIVGHIVKAYREKPGLTVTSPKVNYSVRSKQEYVSRLAKIFDSGKEINVDFSDFTILSHPTMTGIYGVTLRQKYNSGQYSDDGFLFLLWDFRNSSMPLIHVRTWQPYDDSMMTSDDIIDLSDFNLE